MKPSLILAIIASFMQVKAATTVSVTDGRVTTFGTVSSGTLALSNAGFGGDPATITYTITDDFDGDTITEDLVVTITASIATGSAGTKVNHANSGSGGSFGITGNGTGQLSVRDTDSTNEILDISISVASLSLSGGGTATPNVSFDSFAMLGINNNGTGESFDLTVGGSTTQMTDDTPQDISGATSFTVSTDLNNIDPATNQSDASITDFSFTVTNIQAVPEPSLTLLSSLGLLFLLKRRR